jgi:hypothetical protein
MPITINHKTDFDTIDIPMADQNESKEEDQPKVLLPEHRPPLDVLVSQLLLSAKGFCDSKVVETQLLGDDSVRSDDASNLPREIPRNLRSEDNAGSCRSQAPQDLGSTMSQLVGSAKEFCETKVAEFQAFAESVVKEVSALSGTSDRGDTVEKNSAISDLQAANDTSTVELMAPPPSILVTPDTKKNTQIVVDSGRRRRFRRIYETCTFTIVMVLATLVLLNILEHKVLFRIDCRSLRDDHLPPIQIDLSRLQTRRPPPPSKSSFNEQLDNDEECPGEVGSSRIVDTGNDFKVDVAVET